MKHFALYIGLATALFASCTQEEDIQTPSQEAEVFYASFEQPNEDGTRVYVNEDLLLRWTANDRVSIFNKISYNKEYKFTGQSGDVAGGFSKVFDEDFIFGEAIPHVVSVYPYRKATTITVNEVISVDLPAEQIYAESSFGLGANTMVSVTSDNVLQYKSVCGFLMLKLYGNGHKVSSITLKGNNGEKLAGKASITMPLGGVPTVEMASDATTEITLKCTAPILLGSTEEESKQFWFVIPPVTFSKGFTIKVALSTGNVYEKSTSNSITIERNNLSKMSLINIDAPEVVDLGLSVKWASSNLGAFSPEKYGNYYAWGELSNKTIFSWSSYRFWLNGSSTNDVTFSKYVVNDTRGIIDGRYFLEDTDDVACQMLGGRWRMPTFDEFSELVQECDWKWMEMNGVMGMKVTSKKAGYTDKWIFLPAAGHVSSSGLIDIKTVGTYLSSDLSSTYSPTYSSRPLYFTSSGPDLTMRAYRYAGFPVRPVYSSPNSVSWVKLNTTSLDLEEGRSARLTAVVLPETADNKQVRWSSSDSAVASVDASGNVRALKCGVATITVTTEDGKRKADCLVAVLNTGVEAVDLGLPSGIRWRSLNLGATKPEEYGDYYAWGEIEPYYSSLDPLTWKDGKKAGYTWASYKWCMGTDDSFTKYCSDSRWGYNKFTDGKTVLEFEDDAAHVNLGYSWRMPTEAEWEELKNCCTWIWYSLNGVNGRLVIGKNGNSIFLPAAGDWSRTSSYHVFGWGYYWSAITDASRDAVSYQFGTYGKYAVITDSYKSRCAGLSVRPVYDVPWINPESVSLNKSSLSLYVNHSEQLIAAVSPPNATDKSVLWSSSNTSVATVSADGVVTGVTEGSATIMATTADGGKTATCKVTVTAAVPEAIDLGLPSGVKWASFNVGASKPEEYGEYFAWGETEPKTNYSWSTYKYELGTGYQGPFSKYVTNSSYGTVDNNTVLDPEDDAAHVNWGGSWRMPTRNEWEELFNNCTWTWTTQNGVNGRKVTGPNGKSVFLPAAGDRASTYLNNAGSRGYYWSSSLNSVSPCNAYFVDFFSDLYYWNNFNRYHGFSVRPVCD